MIPEKVMEVLKDEGIVSIVTQSKEAHVVNTWNSYINITEDEEFLVPVGRMNTTEKNIKENNKVLMTFGSREVEGLMYKGTGFLIEGTGEFSYEGKNYDMMKEKFPWIRATLIIKADNITQTL